MRFSLSLIATAATLALSVAAACVPTSGTMARQDTSDEPYAGAGSRQLPSPNSEDQGGTGVKGSAQSEGATNKDTAPRDTSLPRRETIVIAPKRRTMMRDYVAKENIRPRHFNERIIVGSTLPNDVELAPVPEAWGPDLRTYRYVYGDDRIFFVDPANRRVVHVLE